jgi:hypothetical protein
VAGVRSVGGTARSRVFYRKETTCRTHHPGTSLAQDAAVLHARPPGLIVDTTSIVTLCRDGASLDCGLLKEMLDLFESEVAARIHDLVEALASGDRRQCATPRTP